MNTKRKADLQRKLGMAPVVRPPAGLAERIKADIPRQFGSANPHGRHVPVSFRVAASIILLVISAYIGVRLLSTSDIPNEEARPSTIGRPAAATRVVETATQSPSAPLPNAAAASETVAEPVGLAAPPAERHSHAADSAARLDNTTTTSSAPLVQVTTEVAQAEPSREAAPVAKTQIATNRAAEASPSTARSAVEGGMSARAPAPAAPAAVAVSSADFVAAAPAPPAEAAARVAATANRTQLEQPEATKQAFGLSIDNSAFARVKSAIDRGESPAAGAVDVEALVNYFAGAPARAPHDVSLDVEASGAPVAAEKRTYVIRSTVDTAAASRSGALPAVGTHAHIETAFNPSVVVSHRLIGSETDPAGEASLARNLSVTALYEVVIRPDASPDATVAVIRLYYRSAGSKSETTIAREVHVSDLRPWTQSSRRHRLASLGAAWGERLKGGGEAADVARKAEELSSEEPRDQRARDLAAVASAFSRLRNSGSTGSGR